MSNFSRVICTLATALILSAPQILHAQSDGDEQNSETGDAPAPASTADGTGGEPGAPAPSIATPTTTIATQSVTATVAATPATNASVASSISASSGYCGKVQPAVYAVDCLSERLGSLAKELEGQEEFADVREVLLSTSTKLNSVARKNRSRELRAARFSTPGSDTATTSRRLIPVDQSKVGTAVAQALAVIEEAQTLLLRSGKEAGATAIQFQRIASALGSNKVLLRSI